MSAAILDLEEAIDLGYGFDWGLTRDGRCVRLAKVGGGVPVRFILADAARSAHIGKALDVVLVGPLAADEVSELSSWRREGRVSVRQVDAIGLEVRFIGADEDVEIAVDAAIDAVLAQVNSCS